MDYKKSPIVLDALMFVVPLAVFVAISIWWVSAYLTVFFVLIAFFVLWFFRNPERSIPGDPGAIVSPADGRVIKIEEVDETDMLDGKFKKISIFMNIFNVHIPA